jgi:hypothetical protein
MFGQRAFWRRRGETATEPAQEDELFPQPDMREVEERFRTEFTACRDLLALAWARKPIQTREVWQHLLLAVFARSILTFRAVMQLCRGGFGEQADMLNRSLFEDMAAAPWMSLHGDEALERMEQHHQHSRAIGTGWLSGSLASANPST